MCIPSMPIAYCPMPSWTKCQQTTLKNRFFMRVLLIRMTRSFARYLYEYVYFLQKMWMNAAFLTHKLAHFCNLVEFCLYFVFSSKTHIKLLVLSVAAGALYKFFVTSHHSLLWRTTVLPYPKQHDTILLCLCAQQILFQYKCNTNFKHWIFSILYFVNHLFFHWCDFGIPRRYELLHANNCYESIFCHFF